MALNGSQKQERSEYLEKNLEITECSQRKPYVFISYASNDWETVFKTAVVPMQKQYGLRVYADKAFDKVNDRWIVPMLRNVRGADAMVVFVSQSYIESYACFLELLTAVNNKKPIVFVSLEQQLDLGDTTDQPDVERGVKAEIFNQGQNIATNVNNTSNDLMRAMKSAYTSISTLLEQDALSKYDISDAFINFFRDAAINRKSINDLNAVRRTIRSISRDVFDQALITASMPAAAPVGAAAADTVQPAPQTGAPPAAAPSAAAKKLPNKKILIGAAAAAVAALVLVLVLVLGGGTKNVTDRQYTTPDGFSGVYTGQWKGDGPSGQGVMTLDSGDVFEGEWADGVLNGQGTGRWANGNVYVGEFKDNLKSGTGTFTWKDPFGVYEGEWLDNKPNGTGTMTYADTSMFEGTWKDGQRIEGTLRRADGIIFEGEFDPETSYFIKGKVTEPTEDGDIVYEGEFNPQNSYLINGRKTWPDGGYYDGTWDPETGGFISGTRRMQTSDGGWFEGEWSNGQANGHGTWFYNDGTSRSGTWKDNYFVSWDDEG